MLHIEVQKITFLKTHRHAATQSLLKNEKWRGKVKKMEIIMLYYILYYNIIYNIT